MACETHGLVITICQVGFKKGVLHLDQKEFDGGRMRKGREKIERRERKRERKGGATSTDLQCSNKQEVQRLRSELGCTPRGRGSLLLLLVLV